MHKVLLVTTNFWPEPTGISVYTTDLARLLERNNFEVTVLTSLPHYPWWKIPSEFAHLNEGIDELGSIKVIRSNHFIPPRMNVVLRMRFEISLWWNLRRFSHRFLDNDFEVVIACIPTVAAGVIGKNIAKKLGIPFGLIVQDLSGKGAKQSGLRGGALISKIAQTLEESVLNYANSMVVVSPAMRNVILSLGYNESNISQIFNYSAINIETNNRELARSRFGWAIEDFVVLHTGNMGAKQDLENVVKAAKALSAKSKLKIYLIGHGNQEANLKKLCDGLGNILILPAVAEDQYSALLSAADLLLVNERSTQMEMSLPSKLTSYLYSERPVIAAVPRSGATWLFLNGIAELVEAGDPAALASAIEELSRQPEKLQDLGRRGKQFAEANLSAEIGRTKYLEWIVNLINSRK